MDSTTVFVKTALGQEEMTSRSRSLPARVRTMLIMVDGRRSVAELLNISPAPAEAEAHLANLIEGGFIAPAVVAASAPAPAVAPAPAPVAELKEAKRVISAALMDAMGPDADFFTGRVDDATSKADLVQEAERLRKMINDSFNPRRAEQFWEKIGPTLT